MEQTCEKLRNMGYYVYYNNDTIEIPDKKITVIKDNDIFCVKIFFENQEFHQYIDDCDNLLNFLSSVLSGEITFKRMDELHITINNWKIDIKKSKFQKIFSVIRKILNIVIGAGLAVFSLVFLIMWLLYYIDYTSFNWLADSTPVPTAVAGIIIGVSMVHHGITKKPLVFGGTVIYGLGIVLASFGMSLLFWLCSEFRETPKSDFIGTALVFIMFMALGIFMLIGGLRFEKIKKLEEYNVYFLKRIPVLPSDDELKMLVDTIKEKSMKETILIKLNPEKELSIFDSKLGGLPYWDSSRSYPVDSEDRKMVLFAQFNLSQIPENKHLSGKGILQLFLSDYDYSSCYCKAVYHKSIDYSLTAKDIELLEIPDSVDAEDIFFSGECGIDFEKIVMPVSPDDLMSNTLIHDTAKELGIVIDETLYFYELCDNDEEYNYLYSYDNYLLGYPHFINCDIRPDNSKYNTLLFQLDSVRNSKFNVVWGDCGICQFFINDKDLADMNFNDIFFDWDCS